MPNNNSRKWESKKNEKINSLRCHYMLSIYGTKDFLTIQNGVYKDGHKWGK